MLREPRLRTSRLSGVPRRAAVDRLGGGFPLTFAPITIGEQAWVAARAFIAPGVTIGEGAVVGATASVFKDVPPWTIVGGNPARFLRDRVRNS